MGTELIDADGVVRAEVFRCDADKTVTVSVFEGVPFTAVERLIEAARDGLGAFEDGTPLPPRLASP